MTNTLGTCFAAGTDIPPSIANTTLLAERIIFGVDVEIIRIDGTLNIFTLTEITPMDVLAIDAILGDDWMKHWGLPFFPIMLVMKPRHANKFVFVETVISHGHPRSMPCEDDYA